MKHHRVLRVITKLLVPYILLFALYVQFHGDFGPGGGFQAGVIFGAGVILYALVFGLETAQKVAPPDIVARFIALGVLLYGGTGLVTMLLGGTYLDYSALADDPHTGQHIGILAVEFGVFLTVAATMITIFFRFAGRSRSE